MSSKIKLEGVNPAYRTFLALHVSITFLLIIGVAGGLYIWVPFFAEETPRLILQSIIASLAVLWFVFAVFWAPRRYRVTHYYVSNDYIGFVVGAVWHTEVVVTFNRLQHLEIAQGPLERILKLSRLVLYTAGGSTADLVIPGLTMVQAEQLRDQVLHELRQEELSDEPISAASNQAKSETNVTN
ncbi:PH domain-containing protein [Aliidiomarina quisquiliarum]|uniref:PH domain-containing protein n=1 Tax=Aliidiomarina quisquiliarum TaxID=2938947 RepID=UPI00208F5CE1|nr:PH domain-containing protein [Aliidiomarina quisquiliarum]MCO4321057.1 PH domain-containing protein [Aliidiomarina quisquiliarum]